jgi:hypothetical protein
LKRTTTEQISARAETAGYGEPIMAAYLGFVGDVVLAGAVLALASTLLLTLLVTTACAHPILAIVLILLLAGALESRNA